MRAWTALLVIAVLTPAAADIGADQLADCAPPCGWILPKLDIVIDDKLDCGGGHLIFAEGPPDDCYPILEPGASRTYTGMLVWKWEASDEGTYPKEVGKDILIGFSGTSTNGNWLSVDVTGDDMVDGHFVIDDAALVDPDNFRTITNTQGQETVWFWYERPIEITFTRSGDPGSDEVRRIGDREGVLAYFVKGTSSESGPRFKESFGIEEVRFDTCHDPTIAEQVEACPATTDPPQEDVPGLPVAMLLLALFIVRRSIDR